jgi:hypothetical protein
MENEQQNSKILGTLFGSINYDSEENLSKFIDEINSAQATYCIQQALNYAHINGIFSLKESEVISKSLRILFSPISKSET